MSKRDDIKKLAMHDPIVRHGWTLYERGMPFEDALCGIVIALAEANKSLTKELISMRENAPDTRYFPKEMLRTKENQ